MSTSLSSQGILQASPYLRKFPNLHVAGKDIPPPQPQRARPGLLFGALFPPQMSPQLMYISPHLRQCSITDPTSTREAGLGGFSGWIRRNTLFISNNPVGCWWIQSRAVCQPCDQKWWATVIRIFNSDKCTTASSSSGCHSALCKHLSLSHNSFLQPRARVLTENQSFSGPTNPEPPSG